MRDALAIGFLAVADAGDLDGIVANEIKENAVVAAAKAKAGTWRLEFLYIAGAVGQIAVDAVKNM